MSRAPTVTERVKRAIDPDAIVSPIDGVRRTKAQERELNELAAVTFSSAGAEKFLAYLKSITVNMVQGPGVNEKELLHLEGQRYLVAIIERRADNGRRREPADTQPND